MATNLSAYDSISVIAGSGGEGGGGGQGGGLYSGGAGGAGGAGGDATLILTAPNVDSGAILVRSGIGGANGAIGATNQPENTPANGGMGGPGGAASLDCAGTLSAPSITVTQPTGGGTATADIGTLLVAPGGTTVTNSGGSVTIGTAKFDSSSTSLSATGTVSVTSVNLVPPATANGGSTGFSITGTISGSLSVDPSSLSLSAGESITLLTMAGGVPAAWDNLIFGVYKTEVSGNNLLLKRPASSAKSLTSVLGGDTSTLATTGTQASPATGSVSVANSTAILALADIIHTGASMNLYSNSGFSTEITGAGTLALTAGGATHAYIKVTAADGSTAYYDITIHRGSTPVTSAAVSNVTISGTVGVALGVGQTATLTLTNDTVVAAGLSNVDASGWFPGLPAGVTVTANAPAGSSTITLTFGGTPTEASIQQFVITIPGSVLAGGSSITVDANPNAKFNIAGAPKPPSDLPKTGDGFPLGGLLALMGIALVAMGWLSLRLRKGKSHA